MTRRAAARQPCRAGSLAIGERIAAEALDWRGTPFVWGQARKHVGCDCKGLVAGVARACGRSEADSIYGLASSYRADRPVPSALLVEGMAALFDPVPVRAIQPDLGLLEPGDVLLLKHEGQPAHLAIYAGGGRAVHAYHGLTATVRDRDLAVLFHTFPLHSAWRWRA